MEFLEGLFEEVKTSGDAQYPWAIVDGFILGIDALRSFRRRNQAFSQLIPKPATSLTRERGDVLLLLSKWAKLRRRPLARRRQQ